MPIYLKTERINKISLKLAYKANSNAYKLMCLNLTEQSIEFNKNDYFEPKNSSSIIEKDHNK
jgi:hypothetical protein